MVEDRTELHRLLADALVAHLGVNVVGRASHPLVLPTAFAVDLDGPDEDGTLYVHGSVAAGWLRAATDTTVCVTVTELDGLVAGALGVPPLDELPVRGRHRPGPARRRPRRARRTRST